MLLTGTNRVQHKSATKQKALVGSAHGRNLVGDTGVVYPHFFRWGDIICHVPQLYLFRFCIWRSSKKMTFATFCVKFFSC